MKRTIFFLACFLLIKSLPVEGATINGIKSLSRQTENVDISILGDGIDSDGVVSSFKSYQFHVESSNGTPVSSYSWTYELLDKENNYVTIKRDNSSVFSIDPIQDKSLYSINSDGYISGRITLEAVVEGNVLKKYFNLSLDVKPSFISVNIDAITQRPDKLYNLDITATYIGAEYLYYELEEEFSYEGFTQYIYQPDIAHLHFDNLYMDGTVTLSFELVNDYGSTYHVTEIPRQDNPSSLPANENLTIDHYEVINTYGQFMLRTKSYDEINSLPKGIYIVRINKLGGKIETKKIIVK